MAVGSAAPAQAGSAQVAQTMLLETFPTPSTTGVPVGTTLTVLPPDGYDTNGVPYYVVGAGETIDSKRFTGNLIISGNGAVIKNSEIYRTISNGDDHYTFSVTDSTLGAPDGNGCNGDVAIQFDNYTALRVRVRNFSDAFRATTPGGASNISIKDSFAKLCSNSGDHSDGYQGYHGGTNVLIQHNTIDQRSAAPDVTAPIFNSDDSNGISVKNNLLMGGSFTIRLDGDGTQSVAQDNRVVNNSWVWGPVSNAGPSGGSNCPWITWSGNTLVTIDSSYNITSTVGPLNCV
ncbi:hypothetical protein AB0E69_35005 [Kribbella sp. NPDC026611]|uniref:hypothetical protein n=1 Tax=Kribbella sp. NPDC026611 TaxID=3154911 RepID=UPI0033E79D89